MILVLLVSNIQINLYIIFPFKTPKNEIKNEEDFMKNIFQQQIFFHF